MAEELISNLGYETPQSDTKRQKLLECILTGNSKLYLGKVYTEEQLAKLSEEEVDKLLNPISTGLFCLVVALGGWGCFPPPFHNSFVFKVRLLKFCMEILSDRMNNLR